MSRLIDADALKRKAQGVATESWKMGLTARIETTLNQFIDWIDSAPTAVESERKQGEWIKMSDVDGYYYCCSECGEELPRYMSDIPSWDVPYPRKYSIDETDFCPYCGAYMRKGKDNG